MSSIILRHTTSSLRTQLIHAPRSLRAGALRTGSVRGYIDDPTQRTQFNSRSEERAGPSASQVKGDQPFVEEVEYVTTNRTSSSRLAPLLTGLLIGGLALTAYGM